MSINNDVAIVPPLEAWQSLSRVNGWNRWDNFYPDLRYFIDPFGMVFLGGLIGGGSSQQFCTLPPAIRPSYPLNVPVATRSSGGAIIANRVQINTDGRCFSEFSGVNWISLEGVRYRL